MNGWFTAVWLAWGAIFGVAEYRAVKRGRRGDTLSEHVWWLRDRIPFRLGRWLIGGFLAWLAFHFIAEGP